MSKLEKNLVVEMLKIFVGAFGVFGSTKYLLDHAINFGIHYGKWRKTVKDIETDI